MIMFTDRIEAWSSLNVSNRWEQAYTTTSTDFFVIAMVIDPSTDTLSTCYDGTGFVTTTSAGGLDNLSNSNDFDIGDGLSGMEFAELAVYNRVLTEEEWNDVGHDLGTKYGITTTYVDTVPEPVTLGLMGAGLIGLFGVRRMTGL